MSKKPHPIHSTEAGSINQYAKRRLKGGLMVLEDLCSHDSSVLDLGCGPGSITLDVARQVVPDGTVTGVDYEEVPIARARDLASQRDVTNVSFTVADVHSLPFPDSQFDVTYANALLEWVDDPVNVVKEMMRVTKPGGSVVARNNDYDTMKLYPPLPAFEKYQRGLGYFRDAENKGAHGSRWRGRELFSIFVRAELVDTRVIPDEMNVSCYGTEQFQQAMDTLLRHVDPDRGIGSFAFVLVDEGILTMDDIVAIREEINEFRNNPEAFAIHPNWFTAVGMVP